MSDKKASDVDYQKMFANCKLPNEQPSKTVEERDLPCGCSNDRNPIYWNEFNGVVQCHKCGAQYIKGATDNRQGITLQDVVKAVNNWAMTRVDEDDVVKFLNQNK